MTKQSYIRLTELFEQFLSLLEEDNSRFDREKFLNKLKKKETKK